MKKLILYTTFLFLSVLGYAQNLVPNPSFELKSSCPPGGGGGINLLQDWFNPTLGTPDFFDTCANGNGSGIPLNVLGYQNAIEGSSYVGLLSWYDSVQIHREYIEVKLISSLQANLKYYVNLYVSLADTSRDASDQIGCVFSNDTIKSQNALTLNYAPQVFNPDFNYLIDKQNWIKISGTFIAQGNENFLTIGNFKDSTNTHVIYSPGGSNLSQYKMAYYYIDYVCVSSDSLTCNQAVSIKENKKNEISLFPNPAKDVLFVTTKFEGILQVEIYNLIGEKVFSINLNGNNCEIPLSGFSNGIYFFQIKTPLRIQKQKIIINH